ncbi:hypothetical protein AAG570_012070, partial [Ranatra chinensis]
IRKNTYWKCKVQKFIYRHIPITYWLLNYSKEDAFCDVVAGVTICLTMVPQSIAYASLANLSPEFGLNSAFMGCFIYVFFGTIKEVVIGPSSLMALLTLEFTHDLNADFVILLCFICGIVELAMGLLKLGFIVELISSPVVSGFTSATSIIIIFSQIKGLLGVNFKSKGFIDNLMHLIKNITDIQHADFILGIGCIILLLILRQMKDIPISGRVPSKQIVKKLLWFLSISRNAMVVVIGSGISAYYINSGGKPPFITTNIVQSGLPQIQFPPVSSKLGNTTIDFPIMVQKLGSGIVVIPIVSILANVAIAKAFKEGPIDATQEMITLALANIFGSFVQSMPTSGAFTRSAVISASGVRTPLAGLYSASLTLLSLKFLAPYFHLIPRSTLSAILITAVIFLIDVKIFFSLWKNSKFDLSCLMCTLLCCVFLGVEIGLLIGITLSLSRLIYLFMRPVIKVEKFKKQYGSFIQVTPKIGLFFPTMDILSRLITEVALNEGMGVLPIVIDCTHFVGLDYTAAKVMYI